MNAPPLAMLALAATLAAQDAPSFHADVLPILREHCTSCHRPADPDGDLALTTFGHVMAGIDGVDPVVLPGDPTNSLLVDVLVPHGSEPPAMPEDADPLSDAQVDVIRRWIAAGAIDDTPAAPAATAPEAYRVPPVVTDLCWAPDPERESGVLLTPGRHELFVLSSDGELLRRVPSAAERIESLAVSPDGSRVAVCGGAPGRRGTVEVFAITTGERLALVSITDDSLFGASWSPHGTQVAFGGTDTVVRTIDAATGAEILFQGAHDDWVLDTCWSTDGSHLISVGRDRSMKLTKVTTQQFLDNITSITPGALKGGLLAVDRRPGHDELLVAGASGVPGVFRTYREKKRVIGDDFNRIHTLDAMPGRVFDLVWSQDGAAAFAVSSSTDAGALRRYAIPLPPEDAKAERGAPATAWTAAVDTPLFGVALSPDGSRVAVGGRDGSLRLFDAATGDEHARFVPAPIATVSTETAGTAGGAR